MRKPTIRQFLTGYFAVWIVAQYFVGTSLVSSGANTQKILMTFSMVNMLFVIINLIGVCFAGTWVPWRDDNR